MPPLTTMAQHYNNTATTSRAVHIHSHVHYSLSEYTREDNICASACVVGMEMQIFQNKCLRLALGVTYLDRIRTIDLHDLTNVPMIKTRMTALAVKTFRSLENTQCFKDLVLNHEIVQKRSGSNTILDQLLAEIQADA